MSEASALCLWLCLLRFSEMCSFSKLYTSFTLGPYFWKYYFKIQFTGKWITINEESIREDHIYSLQYHPHHIPQFAPLPFFYFIMVRIDQSRWSNQTKQVLPSTNLLQATNYTFRCSKELLCHLIKVLKLRVLYWKVVSQHLYFQVLQCPTNCFAVDWRLSDFSGAGGFTKIYTQSQPHSFKTLPHHSKRFESERW